MRVYEQHQALLLPLSLGAFIEESGHARVVDRILDQVRPELLEAPLSEGRRPAFLPRMILKVIGCAYCNRIYSCRRIAPSLPIDVACMWLSGLEQPDFRTSNRFRGESLRETLAEIFGGFVPPRFSQYLLRCPAFRKIRSYPFP